MKGKQENGGKRYMARSKLVKAKARLEAERKERETARAEKKEEMR